MSGCIGYEQSLWPSITSDKKGGPTSKAAPMRGSNLAFVVGKSFQILSSDHVPGSLLRNGHRLHCCVLTAAPSEGHIGIPSLEMRKPPNCPIYGGGNCGSREVERRGQVTQPGKDLSGLISAGPHGAGMGQGQEEELGDLAGLSTKVLWNGQEDPSDPQNMIPRAAEGAEVGVGGGAEMQSGVM